MGRKPDKLFALEKPELLNQWHKNKNEHLNPYSLGVYSNKIAWWICPDCKSEYDTPIYTRSSGGGCPYCAGRRVNHTNSLWSTHPYIAEMLKEKDMGNEVTAGSHRKEVFICNKCGTCERKQIKSVATNGLRCGACSDGISYPEKFVYCMLKQLGIVFEKEVTFDWSKGVNSTSSSLNGDKRYDFYVPSLNLIIETHGAQHYDEKLSFRGRTLQEEKANDELKKQMAVENGIKNYVIIDCSVSDLYHIRKNVENSSLNSMMNISSVDWNLCHKKACSSLVKTVSEMWNSNGGSTVDIANSINIKPGTVVKYLKQGNLLGWCEYDPEEVKKHNGRRIGGKNAKEIVQIATNGQLIKVWSSAVEAGRYLNIYSSNISTACKGKHKIIGGYGWMYKEDYDNLSKKEIRSLMLSNNYCTSRSQKIIQLTLKNEYIKEWLSFKQIETVTGINRINIWKVCKNKQKSSGGYKWMYKEDYVKYIEQKNLNVIN